MSSVSKNNTSMLESVVLELVAREHTFRDLQRKAALLPLARRVLTCRGVLVVDAEAHHWQCVHQLLQSSSANVKCGGNLRACSGTRTRKHTCGGSDGQQLQTLHIAEQVAGARAARAPCSGRRIASRCARRECGKPRTRLERSGASSMIEIPL